MQYNNIKNISVEELAKKIEPVLRKYGIVRAAIFGSVARGEARPDSDLDLLVEYDPNRRMSLHDLVALNDEVSLVAGRKAEIVQYKMIRQRIRDYIINDQMTIYEKR